MIGSTVGNYRIVRELGRGGMGAVYLGEHTLLGRPAAIKLLRADLCEDREVVQRFFNEARASSLIQHGGIVDVLDYGQHEDGRAYLIMEYLAGESLGARLDRDVRLPTELAVRISWQIAAGLAAAHAKGIVHRDLKPDNLLLVPDEAVHGGLRVKILDFGIAKLSPHLDAGGVRTQTQISFGTPQYMSPEQLRSAARVDGRADIYALGCILYEMLGGRPPFVGDDLSLIANAHIFEPVPPLPVALEPALEQLVLAMLAKEPSDRPASMSEVGEQLTRVLDAPPAVATPAAPTAPPAPAPARARPPAADPRQAEARAPTVQADSLPSVTPARAAPASRPAAADTEPPASGLPVSTLRGSAGELGKRWGPGRRRSKAGLVAAVSVVSMVAVIVGIAVLRQVRSGPARPPSYTSLWGPDGGAALAAGGSPGQQTGDGRVTCQLRSNLSGARIAVDDGDSGQRISAGGTAALELTPGPHVISLHAAGVSRGRWPVTADSTTPCSVDLRVEQGAGPRMRPPR